jgi:hypothetical protein
MAHNASLGSTLNRLVYLAIARAMQLCFAPSFHHNKKACSSASQDTLQIDQIDFGGAFACVSP